jgi:hypothetical protein
MVIFSRNVLKIAFSGFRPLAFVTANLVVQNTLLGDGTNDFKITAISSHTPTNYTFTVTGNGNTLTETRVSAQKTEFKTFNVVCIYF